MRINHNISSMVTQGALCRTTRSMSKSLEKLSTGLRVNRASDDAAGLGVSENLRTQVRGIQMALRNTQDAISLLNIADGALNEQAAILQRMRELIIQAKNDTYTSTERSYMGDEFGQLFEELDRIAQTSNFNGMQLFAEFGDTGNGAHVVADGPNVWTNPADNVFGAADSGGSHHFNMMVGANYTAADIAALTANLAYDPGAENMITIQLGQMDGEALFSTDCDDAWHGESVVYGAIPGGNPFVLNALELFLYADVQDKLTVLLNAIDGDPMTPQGMFGDFIPGTNATGLERVNTMRAYIGAMTNRLEHNVNNLMNGAANQQAAESIIRDADFASETMEFTKNQILTRSATSMLAQANMVPSSVLTLIR